MARIKAHVLKRKTHENNRNGPSVLVFSLPLVYILPYKGNSKLVLVLLCDGSEAFIGISAV